MRFSLLILFFAILAISSLAEVFTVDTREANTVANDGVRSLQEAITAAENNGEADTIVFARNIRKVVFDSEITIDEVDGEDIIITGPSNLVTFDGQNLTRLLNFNSTAGGELILQFIEFEDGNSGGVANDGGALFIASGTTANVINCEFNKCVSLNDGGAIHVDGSIGDLVGTSFSNCEAANNGGAIRVTVNGAVEKIANCEFDKNESGANGGAIINNGDVVEIVACEFNNNRAVGDGGAIFQDDGGNTTVVDSCTFQKNRAGDDGDNQSGGAINADTDSDMVIEECLFQNNQTTLNGGAIFTNGIMDIVDTSFVNNKTLVNNGGGIFYSLNSDIVVERTTFEKNKTANLGGGTYSNGDGVDGAVASFVNCTWSANTSVNDGGGHFADNPTSEEFIDCTFTRNKAQKGAGGGIFVDATEIGIDIMTLNSTIVENNDANNNGNDAGVFGEDLAEADGTGFIDGGSNLIEDPKNEQDDFVDGINANIVGVDADLLGLKNNGGVVETHALKNGSVAIDAGDDGNGVDEDAREFGINGNNDIGAFEFNGIGVLSISAKEAGLSAKTTEQGVVIQWKDTDSEGILGFHVWRKKDRERRYAKISPMLVMSKKGLEGADGYTFVDQQNFRCQRRAYYMIECIRADGKKCFSKRVVARK